MIDIDTLLQPISDASPAGPNLRLLVGDMTLNEVRSHRVEKSPVGGSGKPIAANWSALIQVCQDTLRSRTKDLEIACYLAEGLAHAHGFGGLAAGLDLILHLLDRYWDDLHPGKEAAEIIFGIRARPLNWIGSSNEFLVSALDIPIGRRPSGAPLTWRDYGDSARVDQAQLAKDRTVLQEFNDADMMNGDDFRAAMVAGGADEVQGLIRSVQDCAERTTQLSRRCDDLFIDDAPSLIGLQRRLDEILDYTRRLAHSEDEDLPQGGVEGGEQEPDEAAFGGPPTTGPIRTRQEAFRRLQEAADFLRQTEPHSPVGYLVLRALKWGSMPLVDFLTDVIKDPQELGKLKETLGLHDENES